MLPLNLHHLYYFWMVAREGSVTRACEKLFLSQSTVSGQLIQLEKFFGVPLFDRQGRRLRLTKEGQAVFRHAVDIFSETRALVDRVRKGFQDSLPTLRLGIDSRLSKGVIVRLLHQIQREHPSLSLHLWEGSFRELVRRLNVMELDLFLSDESGAPGTGDRLIRQEVGRQELYWSASPSLASRVASFPADLARVPILLSTTNSTIWASVQDTLARWQIEPSVSIQLPDLELMAAAAREGLGAAPLHALAAGDDWKQRRLIRLHHRPCGIAKTFWLITRERARPHPAVKSLLRGFRLNR